MYETHTHTLEIPTLLLSRHVSAKYLSGMCTYARNHFPEHLYVNIRTESCQTCHKLNFFRGRYNKKTCIYYITTFLRIEVFTDFEYLMSLFRYSTICSIISDHYYWFISSCGRLVLFCETHDLPPPQLRLAHSRTSLITIVYPAEEASNHSFPLDEAVRRVFDRGP